jgi:hypothetical protein
MSIHSIFYFLFLFSIFYFLFPFSIFHFHFLLRKMTNHSELGQGKNTKWETEKIENRKWKIENRNGRYDQRSPATGRLPLPGPALLTVSSLSHLLELLPLLWREHGLQALVGVLAHLTEPGLRLFAQLSQLLPRVFKYLVDLRPLILRQIQPVEHLLEPAAPTGSGRPVPVAIDVHCQPTRDKADDEQNKNR